MAPKKISMPIVFHVPSWGPSYPFCRQNYFSYVGVIFFVRFYTIFFVQIQTSSFFFINLPKLPLHRNSNTFVSKRGIKVTRVFATYPCGARTTIEEIILNLHVQGEEERMRTVLDILSNRNLFLWGGLKRHLTELSFWHVTT